MDLISDPSDLGRYVDQLTLPLKLEHKPIIVQGIFAHLKIHDKKPKPLEKIIISAVYSQ